MIQTSNRAALYARFSSDNQRAESIDAQLRAMRGYCAQHHFTIVNTYVDEARSATTDRRPAFQQMIIDSAAHTFDIVLVHKLDRFARNRYDSAIYKRELKKNGVAVYSVLENLDNSPESVIMESVLEGMAEYYSQNLGREVMKGMTETALQCKHTGGKPPLGYDVDPVTKKLVINEGEAEIVRAIFEMYAEDSGYSDILRMLHERGARTKAGNAFAKNSLHEILCNQKYAGVYVFNRSSPKAPDGTRNSHRSKDAEEIVTIPGGCPQIVSTDIYNKVAERMSGHKRDGGRRNAKQRYLLSGKLFCRDCGRAMVGNAHRCGRNKALLVTYRCPSQRHVCRNKEINRDYLERYVIVLLEREIFDPSAMRRLVRQIEKQQDEISKTAASQQETLGKQLSCIEAEAKNIADAIGQGLLSSTLAQRLEELEEQRARLEHTLNHAIADTCVTPTIDPALLPKRYAELQQAPASPAFKSFIGDFIERVVVGRYEVAITIKAGLGITDAFDRTIVVRRQEVYGR